jgi:8-oxo-dGTP pyrophosphatase MutT (NUDIX family)
MPALEKVTAFITRPALTGMDLLLFHHPSAGIQFPAGTVEEGEAPQAASLREAEEESGLQGLRLERPIAVCEEGPVIGDHFIAQATTVYSRPDCSSFDWAHFRRGLTVRVLRRAKGFVHVTFEEPNRWPNPQYATYQITGWIPQEVLCKTAIRHFYLFAFDGDSPEKWTVAIDRQIFTPFWAPLTNVPEIIAPQRPWLDLLIEHLGDNR